MQHVSPLSGKFLDLRTFSRHRRVKINGRKESLKQPMVSHCSFYDDMLSAPGFQLKSLTSGLIGLMNHELAVY